MQHGVNGQKADLTLQGVTVHICLLDSHFQRDDHIAQQCAAGLLVGVIVAVLSQGKGKHIGGTVFLAIDLVQSVDLIVADKGDADFGILPEMLRHQDCLAAAADEHSDSYRDPYFCLIVFYHDFYFWHDERSPFMRFHIYLNFFIFWQCRSNPFYRGCNCIMECLTQ